MINFELEIFNIKITNIKFLKHHPDKIKNSVKFKNIISSINEIGIIEPLIVFKNTKFNDQYFLNDGHLRIMALSELGFETAPCLITQCDDTYTYNHRINKISVIQEHFMIKKAIENGVTEEKISKALGIDIKMIKKRTHLLDKISPEVVKILKKNDVSYQTMMFFKKVLPVRQIEMANLMESSGDFTFNFARALFMGTPKENININALNKKKSKNLTIDEIEAMEKEISKVESEFLSNKDSAGKNMLQLTILIGYLVKCFKNPKITQYLEKYHFDIFGELSTIVNSHKDIIKILNSANSSN